MGKSTTARDGVRQWRQWSEDEARSALEALAVSGESAAGYARRKGFSPHRFAYWRKRLAEPAKTEFMAIALPSPPPACIEIAACGIVVRVREDMDTDQVAGLVQAIGRRVGTPC